MGKDSYNKLDSARLNFSVLRFGVCIVIALACITVISGCGVEVAGNKRNLIEHGRIKGEVELISEIQNNSQSGNGTNRKSRTVIFEERLRVKTKGDIYHPYLAAFSAAIGAGLVQQDFNSTEVSGRTSDTLSEYDLTIKLLQAKPYPIDFFTNKSQYLVARQYLGALKTETKASGGSFSLRTSDWPMNFSFSNRIIRQDSLTSTEESRGQDFLNRTEDKFNYGVSHSFSTYSNLYFEFERNENKSERINSATQIKQERSRLTHYWDFGDSRQHNLNSSFEFLDTSDSSRKKNLRLTEQLRLRHSDDLTTGHTFNFTESKLPDSTNTNINLKTGFKHQLYDSLSTSGQLSFTESKIGDVTEIHRRQDSLSFNYRKENRFGIFSSSYSAVLTNSDQSGGSGVGFIVDESHAATSTPVVLDRRNINVSSIILKDQFGDTYDEGVDYLVTELDGRVLIDLIPFGMPAPFFSVLDGTETFLVDYDYFIEPNREEEQLYQRYSIRQQFDNGLSVHYQHMRRDEDITSNVTSVTPDELREDVFGIDYNKGGFGLYAEYRDIDSTQVVSKGKRLRGDYRWEINPVTRAILHASLEKIDYTLPDVYKSTNTSFGGGITSELTSKWDSVTNVNYFEDSDTRSRETTGLRLATALKYKYRQLRMSTGVEYNFLNSQDNKQDYSLIYLRVKRLF